MSKNGEIVLTRRANTALARRMDPLEEFVAPRADIYETSDAFIVKTEMPGVQKSMITVDVEPGKLRVKGSMGLIHGEDANLVMSEMVNASYFRELNLGNGIDAEHIQADYNDGVLTVLLPKHESMKPREILIR